MAVRLAPLLFLTACFRSTSWFECDDVAMPVSDSEVTPGGTAAELLALLSGSATTDGLLLDSRVIGVTWTLTRGEGSAEWITSTQVAHTEGGQFGLGHGPIPTSDLDCHDRLEVPVVASVNTDDLSVDVNIATVAESRPDQGVVTRVWGVGAYDDATLPPVPDVNPADFDNKVSFIVLGLDSSAVSGRAGWEGSETESSSSAFYVIDFPVPEE